MSVTTIPADLRRLVEARSERLCEYCLIDEEDTCLGCQIDHVISEKHGGPTNEANLAFACVYCNQSKGSDVGSILMESGTFVRFYNPRKDRWSEHFRLKNCQIELLTEIGAATARILQFNSLERLLERQALTLANRYPSETARNRMEKGNV